jgi:hypothetical protein
VYLEFPQNVGTRHLSVLAAHQGVLGYHDPVAGQEPAAAKSSEKEQIFRSQRWPRLATMGKGHGGPP